MSIKDQLETSRLGIHDARLQHVASAYVVIASADWTLYGNAPGKHQ